MEQGARLEGEVANVALDAADIPRYDGLQTLDRLFYTGCWLQVCERCRGRCARVIASNDAATLVVLYDRAACLCDSGSEPVVAIDGLLVGLRSDY